VLPNPRSTVEKVGTLRQFRMIHFRRSASKEVPKPNLNLRLYDSSDNAGGSVVPDIVDLDLRTKGFQT